jgi:hypothetical protein
MAAQLYRRAGSGRSGGVAAACLDALAGEVVRQLGMKRDSATVQAAPELALVDSDQRGRPPNAETPNVSQQHGSMLLARKALQDGLYEGKDLLERIRSLTLISARPSEDGCSRRD